MAPVIRTAGPSRLSTNSYALVARYFMYIERNGEQPNQHRDWAVIQDFARR